MRQGAFGRGAGLDVLPLQGVDTGQRQPRGGPALGRLAEMTLGFLEPPRRMIELAQ